MPSLDNRTISLIFDKLDVRDVIRCANVDKQWRAVAFDDARWKLYCNAHLHAEECIGASRDQMM